jgi:hypothetical protein
LFQCHPADDLFRAPFIADQRLDLLPDPAVDAGLCLAMTSRKGQGMCLFWRAPC